MKVHLTIGAREDANAYHHMLGGRTYPERNFYECLYYYGTDQASAAGRYCDDLSSATDVTSEDLRYAALVSLDLGDYQTALQRFIQINRLWGSSKAKHIQAEEAIVLWGSAVGAHLKGRKKEAKDLFQTVKKTYPEFTTISSLKTLPYVWSDRTLELFSEVMTAYK